MIGPDPDGLGGISRVAKTWRDAGLFDEYRINYIASVTDKKRNRMAFLLGAFHRFFRALLLEADVVYVHTSSDNSFYRKLPFILLALVFRQRVVLHVHPAHFYDFVCQSRGGKRKLIDFVLMRVHAAVVLSEGIKNNMERVMVGQPVFVLPNSVDCARLTNRLGYQRRVANLLYLGWFIKKKGVYDLVDSVGLLLEKGFSLTLDFYGTKQVGALRAYVKSKGLESAIRVNGWIGDEEKLKALYTSTMLVLPSHTEGMPNVILEAMATRTPIVSTLSGGLKDILKDEKNAIIAEVANPEHLSERIQECLENHCLREEMAENAYREVKEKYDVSVIKKAFGRIV